MNSSPKPNALAQDPVAAEHLARVCADFAAAWEEALAGGAALAFCESASNPTLEIIDLAAVARLTHRAGGLFVVDNVFATPLLQQPLAQGADVVVYSATKHIDGQGRCLGGAILGSEKFISDDPRPRRRHTQPL